MSTRGYFSNGINVDAAAMIAVGAGKVPTASGHNITSSKNDIAVGSYEVLSQIGASTTPDNAGEAITAVSTSAADTAVNVLIIGLDADWLEQKEVVTLTGLTPVAVPGIWTRVNIVTNYSSTVSVGNVEVRAAGVLVNGFTLEAQNSFHGIYTIPANKFGQVLSVLGTMIKTTGQDTAVLARFLFARPTAVASVTKTVFGIGMQKSGSTTVNLDNSMPLRLDGPFDITVEAQADAADADAIIFIGLLLQDK